MPISRFAPLPPPPPTPSPPPPPATPTPDWADAPPPPAGRSAIERAFSARDDDEGPPVEFVAPSVDRPLTAPDPEPEPDSAREGPHSSLHFAADDDPRAEPGDRPSFVVKAERAERWRRPPVRAALVLVSLLGAVALAAQAGYEYRDLAAARLPAVRPLLLQACATLGCSVEPVRAIDSLAVESSGLVRVERSSLYRLSVVLRNRAAIELALPALDITLTDSQGRVVARKVVRVADTGLPQTTLAGGRELALQATLQAAATPGGAAPETIVGYTIELFYP
ncbi:conserved hypothetical protein [Rubrivivax sp. A210]|uniref:DUF3426 domain-containing protein n=1 Tax=Rubrivivax sp. A210 TaxID=2772301 RepID=UPI00198FD01B|nr:DUF3426 domain-containing protein [Rubrivivax sp. A210]CAD5375260.1 conserved hypothetical protein [Rubrivivax sp. A210]